MNWRPEAISQNSWKGGWLVKSVAGEAGVVGWAAPHPIALFARSTSPLGRYLRGGAGLDRNALVLEEVLQLAGLEHLADDVAAADELTLHVELRDRRPLRIGLDALAQVVGFQHVDALI